MGKNQGFTASLLKICSFAIHFCNGRDTEFYSLDMSTHKQTLNDFILLTLEKAIDGYCRFEDLAYHHYRYKYGIPELKKSSLSQALRRLREKGYIEKEIDEGKVIYKLTSIGKDSLAYIFDETTWDGKWRIVMFDIPEDKRKFRDVFRKKLKSWQFKNWQQSIWITKSNITFNLRKLISNLGIEQWVAVIESDDPALAQVIPHGRNT